MAVGKTKDGIIYYSTYYTTMSGERKRKYKQNAKWKTLREARAAEKEFLDSVPKYDEITFDDLYARYLKYQVATKRLSTINSAERTYRLYFGKLYGKKISKINNSVIEDWQMYLLSLGLKNSYLERIQKVLRSCFNYGVKYGIIEKSPFTIPFVKEREFIPKEMKTWTITEFNQFISVIDNPTEKAMFETLFYSACRIGELLALEMADYSGGFLTINKQITKENQHTSVKNKNGNRTIPLPKKLCAELEAIITNVRGYDEATNDWLFCPLTYRSRKQVEYKKNVYCKIAGVKQIRLHDFRHSMITYLLADNKFTYKEVADFVGDDVKTIIDTYGHTYGDLNKRLQTVLDKL